MINKFEDDFISVEHPHDYKRCDSRFKTWLDCKLKNVVDNSKEMEKSRLIRIIESYRVNVKCWDSEHEFFARNLIDEIVKKIKGEKNEESGI